MAGMNAPDREKVIKGLEEAFDVISIHVPVRYWGYSLYACKDAIDLLKPPAPRLLTAEDFENLPHDDPCIPCWKETKSPTRRNGWAVIVYGKWLADQGVARYWTDRPTDVQREAEPWKE